MEKITIKLIILFFSFFVLGNVYNLTIGKQTPEIKYNTAALHEQKEDDEAVLVYQWKDTGEIDFLIIKKEDLPIFQRDQENDLITILRVEITKTPKN